MIVAEMGKFLKDTFQCPLGLIPHFYKKLVNIIVLFVVSFNALSGLYLISTGKATSWMFRNIYCFNALSGLYLISTYPISEC